MRADEALDSIVDEVAQRMTACAPDDEFTADVMRRVARQSRLRRSWRAGSVLAPMAAAAALAIIVVFGARTGVDNRQGKAIPRSPATSTTRPEARRGPESPSPDLIPQTAVEAARTLNTIRMTTPQLGTRAMATRRASPIEPMTVPLLHTPPLTTEAIPADPIAVDRLDPIPLLAVPPLATDDDQRRQE
jgi:hypothetical protein